MITQSPRENHRWVPTWVSMPQLTEPANMPPAPFTQHDRVLADATLRQTVHVSIGGDTMRLRLSNAFGGAALPVTAVSVARPRDGGAGVSAILAGTARAVTFSGRPSVVIPVGAQVVSDPLDFPLAPQSNLSVTMYLAGGQESNSITSHPGSRTTSHLAVGNHAEAVVEDPVAARALVEHGDIAGGRVRAQPGCQSVGPAVVGVGRRTPSVGQRVPDHDDRRGGRRAPHLDGAEEVPVIDRGRVREVDGLGVIARRQMGGGPRAGMRGDRV